MLNTQFHGFWTKAYEKQWFSSNGFDISYMMMTMMIWPPPIPFWSFSVCFVFCYWNYPLKGYLRCGINKGWRSWHLKTFCFDLKICLSWNVTKRRESKNVNDLDADISHLKNGEIGYVGCLSCLICVRHSKFHWIHRERVYACQIAVPMRKTNPRGIGPDLTST